MVGGVRMSDCCWIDIPALTATIGPDFAFLGAGAEVEEVPDEEEEEDAAIADAGRLDAVFAFCSCLVSSWTYHEQKASFSMTPAIIKVYTIDEVEI